MRSTQGEATRVLHFSSTTTGECIHNAVVSMVFDKFGIKMHCQNIIQVTSVLLCMVIATLYWHRALLIKIIMQV